MAANRFDSWRRRCHGALQASKEYPLKSLILDSSLKPQRSNVAAAVGSGIAPSIVDLWAPRISSQQSRTLAGVAPR